jgi:hypothetical protein
LLVLESGIATADQLFHLIALTIVLSIVAHSSTDVVVARQFDEPDEVPAWTQEQPVVRVSGAEVPVREKPAD